VLADGAGPASELTRVPLRAHVIATTPLDATDVLPLRVMLLVGLLGLFLLALPRARAAMAPAAPQGGVWRVVSALGALFVAFVGVGTLPFGGSSGVLVRGLILAATQVALALVLTPSPRRVLLGLIPAWEKPPVAALVPAPDAAPVTDAAPVRPTAVAMLLAALRVLGVVLVGLVLSIAAGRVAELVPSTSVAPVEQLVSWPSASLALGTIGVLVPLAEEIFFRGFVYGVAAARFGKLVGIAVAVVTFGLAHLPQTWGAWGALLAVTLTGLILTLIRAWSRSVYLSALTHLAYNGLIVAGTLLTS